MNDNFTNENTADELKNNNLSDEKKTLNDIKELLEKNKISADDIKRFTEYETVKTVKKDIEDLLKKFEDDFVENKITFKNVDETFTIILDTLKEKRKKKRNKKTTKETVKKDENTAEALKTEETQNF
ncbi:hypothetical protein [Fusobacterium polymorphum]|uniref:hypothetical protein n=1 Tax=Fusobacterium nucleatum subsp. polymorphum TaxID=76857 RepID=UPI001C6F2957|nr:hypothetical protein [Fusobacterium polymorphum]QYR60240.1 hypothetical protein JY397_12150 [Fusobacterium polymorphum]